jgi:glycosyltransferase involved in cell wall biosynthesis
MIAKDEAHCISDCLNSVRKLVSEIILVDTGSTDQTVEIATKLGAKVFHLPWEDDFAKARNFSLRFATGDWIFVLDADERISPRDVEFLGELLKDREICWEFLQRHYSEDIRISDFQPCKGEDPEMEQDYPGFFESGLVRLFPNGLGIEYRGRVHELAEHSINEKKNLKIRRTKFRIHHYGHTRAAKELKKKGKLYTPLGEKKIRDQPTDWKGFFELGVEHNNNGQLQASELALVRSLQLNPLYLDTWVNLGYVQCELKKYDESIATLRRALELQPSSEEALLNMGVVYLRAEKPREAEELFRQALKIKPDYVNAMNNLATVLFHQNRSSEAALILRRILDYVPSHPETLKKLELLEAQVT